MTNLKLRVNCNDCARFTEYRRRDSDPQTVVRCDECGKKHSEASIYMVDLHQTYRRDETGALVEDLP